METAVTPEQLFEVKEKLLGNPSSLIHPRYFNGGGGGFRRTVYYEFRLSS